MPTKAKRNQTNICSCENGGDCRVPEPSRVLTEDEIISLKNASIEDPDNLKKLLFQRWWQWIDVYKESCDQAYRANTRINK